MSANPKSEAERFEALWTAHYTAVFSYVLRRLGDPDVAEDVTSDIFLVAWRRREAVLRKPRPWLLGVARKAVANHLRGEWRREMLVARIATTLDERPQPGPDDHYDFLTSNVAEAFNALSPLDREVLSLVAWEGLKPREAAKALGIDTARFSVRLHRAKKRMRRNLEQRAACGIEAAGETESSGEQPANSEMGMEAT